MTQPDENGENPTRDWDVTARHHIDLIQATIVRMSAASSAAKGWVLPVVTATYGYALTQHADSVAALGMAAALLFWVLDARYLREERAYRRLFAAAVKEPTGRYDMNAARYYLRPEAGTPDCRHPNCRLWRTALSWSTGGFYLPVLGVGLAIALLAR